MDRIDRRVCQCEECLAFPPPTRNRNRKPGKYGESVIWRSRWWWATKSGHYRNEKGGGFLHDVMWEVHKATIPPGYEIHHANGIGTFNTWENLELVTRAAHMERDGRIGGSVEQKHVKQCEVCGGIFRAAWVRAQYCSNACRQRAHKAAHWIPIEARPCQCCGCFFIPKKKLTARFCSSACEQRVRIARLRDQSPTSASL